MKLLTVALYSAMLASSAAQTIGVSTSDIDTFRASLVTSVEAAASHAGLKTQLANAQSDGGKQVADIKQMIASGVSGLVVLGVNAKTEETVAKLARDSNLPLVFVNHEPPHAILGDRVVYVGSDEKESGTLQAQEVCRLLAGKGSVVILIGELTHPAAKTRTHDYHDVFATSACKGIEILEEQSANWDRTQGEDVSRTWLEGGLRPDAIIANNDDMALGAIATVKAMNVGRVIVTGIDATPDALKAMQTGELAATVLQDAAGQGEEAIDMMQSLMKGESIEPVHYVPFQLITPANLTELLASRGKN